MKSDLSPPAGIIKDVENSETGKTEKIFALKSNADWFKLQAVVNGVKGLPIAADGFEERYGSYTHQDDVAACLKMFEKLGKKAETFGTTADLSRALGSGLSSKSKRPDFLLGEMVWICFRLKRATDRVDHTYGSLQRLFSKSRFSDPEARRELLEDAFTSDKGLSGYAKAMHQDVDALRNERLNPLRVELNEILTNEVKKYLDPEHGILKEALDATGPQGEEVAKEANEVAHYDKLYKGLSGASGGTALVILLFSGGLLWPVAAFVGLLGIPAEKARKNRAEHIGKLIAAQEKLQKEITMIADLTPLAIHLQNLQGILERLDGILIEMSDFWKDMDEKLKLIVSSTSIMANGKRIGLLDASQNQIFAVFSTAAEEWEQISDAASEFVRTALVHSERLGEAA